MLPTGVDVGSGGTSHPLVTFTLHGGKWSTLCPTYPWIKNFRYTMNRRMGWPQRPSACFGGHRNLLPLPRSEPSQHKAHSLVTILTMPMKAGLGDREQERETEIEIRRKKETQNTVGGLRFVTAIHLWGQSTAYTDREELGLCDFNFSLLT